MKQIKLFLLTFIPFILMEGSLSGQLTFRWNGDGLENGTGSTDWSDPDNWLIVDGEGDLEANTTGGPPSSVDHVEIFADMTPVASYSVVVPANVTVASMHIRNASGSGNSARRVQFEGDVTMETIEIGITSGNHQSILNLANNAILTLTGGSGSTPTLGGGRDSVGGTAIHGSGTVRMTAEQVFIDFQSGIGNSVDFELTASGVTVDFLDNNFRIENNNFWKIPANATFVNMPSLITGSRVGSMTANVIIVDSEGDPLPVQTSEIFADIGIFTLRGGPGVAHLPGGTYDWVNSYSNSGNNRDIGFVFNEDTTIQGSRGIPGSGPDMTTPLTEEFGAEGVYSIMLYRRNNSQQAYLDPNGYDFTVSSLAPVVIGNPRGDTPATSYIVGARVDGRDPTLDFHPDVYVGINGFLESDEHATWIFRGNLVNRSSRKTLFDMESATLHFLGTGTMEEAQYLELQGEDLGLLATAGEDNFMFGSLVIGSELESTYVRLSQSEAIYVVIDEEEVDLVGDYTRALYLGDLVVHSGSVLDLNFYNVYVDQEGEWELLLPGETVDGGLIVIPEPAWFGLLLGLLGIGWQVRRRVRHRR